MLLNTSWLVVFTLKHSSQANAPLTLSCFMCHFFYLLLIAQIYGTTIIILSVYSDLMHNRIKQQMLKMMKGVILKLNMI